MSIFLSSLLSSVIVIIAILAGVEITERIRYIKKDKNRIDFDKFIKAYKNDPSPWSLYSTFITYNYSYGFRSYAAHENNRLYFTYSDLKKYKKWKKEYDKMEGQRFFESAMTEIDRALSKKDCNTSYQIDSILYATYEDAEQALNRLRYILDCYGKIRISDYYETARGHGHVEINYLDNKYGWKNLDDSDIVKDGDNYAIYFPEPELLD